MAAAERSLSKSGGVHWPDISAISIRFSNTEVGSFVLEALKAYQATKNWNRAPGIASARVRAKPPLPDLWPSLTSAVSPAVKKFKGIYGSQPAR